MTGPEETTPSPVLAGEGLTVRFGDLTAVDGVSLAVAPGASLGLVGESGSGKTTTARVLCGLQTPDGGRVLIDGAPVARRRTVAQRRAVQMVFQDPFASLNPRRRIGSMLTELLRVHDLHPGAERERAAQLMTLVGLPEAALGRYPAAFSGGQRQRIAIARALAAEPRVVIADEPVSALDVSVQATVLRLFAQLRAELGIGLVLISHNLAVVRVLCDTVAVMYLGRIVETASTDELFADPRHPYTRALLDAVPRLRGEVRAPRPSAGFATDRSAGAAIDRSAGAVTDPAPGAVTDPSAAAVIEPVDAAATPAGGAPDGPGCSYAPVCPLAQAICHERAPALEPVGGGPRRAACHFKDTPIPETR